MASKYIYTHQRLSLARPQTGTAIMPLGLRQERQDSARVYRLSEVITLSNEFLDEGPNWFSGPVKRLLDQ